MHYILAIDQGTTSTRAILFDQSCNVVSVYQKEFPQYFPQPGWVEHNPDEIWQSVVETVKGVVQQAEIEFRDVVAIGITNQRETTVAWNRKNGSAVSPAIVWQDRRTALDCNQLKRSGNEELVNQTTGLLLDPYFSATKISWILNHVDGAQAAANRGELVFGTIDTYLLWKLTDGKSFCTDATNASRTMLMDINTGSWSTSMLELFDIPERILPKIKNCADDFGCTSKSIFGASIPIAGIAGDQQAAAIGQACFQPGMMKSTYGTGCFALMNVGDAPVFSKNRLLTTIAAQLNGIRTYALEGSIFSAGATVQWLRDQLGVIERAEQTEELARKSDSNLDVYFVPAFVGLGAPYWDSECRAAIYGLTRGSGVNEIARAALESVCYQTADLVDAMQQDWSESAQTVLRVDGGMAASDWTMQCLADILDSTIDRPVITETTALGAAYLAGYQTGFYGPPDEFAKSWKLDRRFTPGMKVETRMKKISGWKTAIEQTLNQNP